ncbi:amidase domain-containing protein [Sediminibacillus albus]|uniref:Putative amidase domain-containing protein n=1 Tax=Sediminibacillus albus TaxID=407036 RepID=A0A1G9C8W9_9BACI|nr:amidase domain-containing protein [Sediminibacillus albus]SDK48111.1 Putative amidase domain-containing protein [Sediminibacillus albus]
MDYKELLEAYWRRQLDQRAEEKKANWILRKKYLHESRGSKVPRMRGEGKLLGTKTEKDGTTRLQYDLLATFFIKQGNSFYHEEEKRRHTVSIKEEEIINDQLADRPALPKDVPAISVFGKEEDIRASRFNYDRRAAVQYAERWWNEYNPNYKEFAVDCTNYISQCLAAGGAPMRGMPNKGEGWWYQGDSWSYSWAVAHSLRWYLSGSTQGLKGREMEKASDLSPGDVICYDFQGDGRWDHNTIVVTKDLQGEPLVNAHTDNSRHRYWSYEDSMAWTENCKYKFFRIGE